MKKQVFEALLAHAAEHGLKHHFYIDRLHIFLDARAPQDLVVKLKSLSKKNKIISPCTLEGYININQKLELYQVDKKAIKLLKALNSTNTFYRINYVEIALDFYSTNTESLSRLRQFINKHLIVKRGSHKTPFYFRFYDEDDVDPKRKPIEAGCYDKAKGELIHYANPQVDDIRSVCYSDKSGYRFDESKGYVHLEHRHRGLDTLRKLDFLTINDLLTFDYLSYWQDRLRLVRPNINTLGSLSNADVADNTLNKKGNRLFDKIQILQAYLSFYPEHQHCFEPITTEKCLKKFCQL